MPNKAINLLVVDDDDGHRNTLRTLLGSWGYGIDVAADGRSAVEAAKAQPFDLILMDLRMPDMNGIEAMQAILSYNPAIPVVIMTAYSDVETAVAALKAGAYDYLTKPLDFDELKLTLGRALDHASLRQENTSLKKTLAGHDSPILGKSEATRRLLDMVDTIAPSEATVLVTGESGTGKELVARLLHQKSGRAAGPFVTVNCAALSETLLESELFGHEKGAFTGADKAREGRFRSADGGSIFLDEIGEMPLPMQAKLLRAIQEREIQRVGGDRPITVDVRIIAATNRDLGAEVEAGRFRQDLFYRLNVVSLHLPSLRERAGDVPVLADHFLRLFADKNGKRVKGFTPGAMDRLLRHDWPGNVRELENTVERAVVLLIGDYVSERELPPALLPPVSGDSQPAREWGEMTLDEIERAAVREMLQTTGGNKSEAARRLGITRKTLLAKLRGEE